jgi:hypothetical protein
MVKKTLALATLLSFLVFSWSCIYSWKETPLQSVKPEKRTEVMISAVKDRSGEKTEFKKNPGARIQGDSVVGLTFAKNVVLEISKIKGQTISHTDAPSKIIAKDGAEYTAERIIERTSSHIIFDAYKNVSIPLADVDLVWIKKVNVLATLLVAPVLAVGGFLVALALLMGDMSSLGHGYGSSFYSN